MKKILKTEEIINCCFVCSLNEDCKLAQTVDARYEIAEGCPLEDSDEE